MSADSDVVNQALQIVGHNIEPVTGNAPDFDDSTAGKVAKFIYLPAIATVAAQFSWDFARQTMVLLLSGNVAPSPWAFEYLYPANGIEVWDLMPSAADYDPFNPLPINFIVANAVVGGQQQRVIQTNQANAQAIYNNNPTPDTWAPLFREAVVRLLASEFATALLGKPDMSAAMIQSGQAFEAAAEGRRN